MIFEEKQEKYGFVGLTKSDRRGHHKNKELIKNPEKGATFKSYLRSDKQYANKNLFEEKLANYKISEKDYDSVMAFIDHLKAKDVLPKKKK